MDELDSKTREIFGIILAIIMVGLVAFLFSPAPAKADILDKVMVMDNEDGGKIVLTLAPCDLPAGAPIKGAYSAHATDKDGNVHFGCWVRDGVTVNTEWTDAEGVYTYAAHLFRIEEAEKSK